ncbi:hypothetical protein BDP67DRAFT_517347 [Colletotrichum lupini]|nr:hypothetical protein BDP67DRAFT_517347 [Colletotrichum lupini]
MSCSHFKLKQSSLITYLDPNRLLITTAGESIKDHWEPNRPPSRSSGMDSRPDLRAHGYPLPCQVSHPSSMTGALASSPPFEVPDHGWHGSNIKEQ